MDDTIFWDSDLEKYRWQTIEFLDKVGNTGMVLNPNKVQFCQKNIKFAGFQILDSKVSLLQKYLNAIAKFPRPQNIFNIRSWFGLIHQVANYSKLCKYMEPFRPFLSFKVAFQWTPKLEEAFINSRKEIIKTIKEGVAIFNPALITCLVTDWCNTGMGYYMVQKMCKCQPVHLICCEEEWRIVLASSRFSSPAESRYAPVEGETLAIA